MVRFLHTADLQLGMPFQWAGERAADLKVRREECVSRLARVAREERVDFVVVAGDFFDANTVDDRVVVRACKRLEEFDVPVLILPGNHDAGGGPDSVYRREKFLRTKPEWVEVLDEIKPRVLRGGEVVVLPAPLRYRHSLADPTVHLTAEFGRDEAPGAIRVAVAHGGVVDFGSSVNVIDPARAVKAELDYLALGDWHGKKRIDERTWYSGAPEPTSFKDNDPGYALVVEIEKPGDLPKVEAINVASTDWIRHEVLLEEGADLDRLSRWFESLDRPLDTLVRLEYGGSLSFQELRRLEDEILSDAEDGLLFLRRRETNLVPRAGADEIEAMATEGFVGVAVRRLQGYMEGEGMQGEVAARSLEILHRLMRAGE